MVVSNGIVAEIDLYFEKYFFRNLAKAIFLNVVVMREIWRRV